MIRMYRCRDCSAAYLDGSKPDKCKVCDSRERSYERGGPMFEQVSLTELVNH